MNEPLSISLRPEEETDYRVVENLTREAFWDLYHPGCTEHLVVNKMRRVNAFVRELDFVACDGNIVVGNIVYSKARVIDENRESEVLCMGPVSVLPAYQNKGIGSMLMNHSI
jgi:predicted N-acetyltransferase YhbS